MSLHSHLNVVMDVLGIKKRGIMSYITHKDIPNTLEEIDTAIKELEEYTITKQKKDYKHIKSIFLTVGKVFATGFMGVLIFSLVMAIFCGWMIPIILGWSPWITGIWVAMSIIIFVGILFNLH